MDEKQLFLTIVYESKSNNLILTNIKPIYKIDATAIGNLVHHLETIDVNQLIPVYCNTRCLAADLTLSIVMSVPPVVMPMQIRDFEKRLNT